MKTQIATIAVIAVAIVGTITVTGFSATSLMTAGTPELRNSSPILGHIEYTLVDKNGNIKAYGQTDNLVTNNGDRCTAEALFERGSSDTTANANCKNSEFDVIAISNSVLYQ